MFCFCVRRHYLTIPCRSQTTSTMWYLACHATEKGGKRSDQTRTGNNIRVFLLVCVSQVKNIYKESVVLSDCKLPCKYLFELCCCYCACVCVCLCALFLFVFQKSKTQNKQQHTHTHTHANTSIQKGKTLTTTKRTK